MEPQGRVQGAFQLDALLCHGVHALCKALEVIPAALLGAVHCRVGIRSQRFDALSILGIERNADASGGADIDTHEV